MLGPAKVPTPEMLNNIGLLLAKESRSEIVQPCILNRMIILLRISQVSVTVAWITPPSRRKFHFSYDKSDFSTEIDCPRYLIVYDKGDLWIYAAPQVPGNEDPLSDEFTFYHSALMNVSDSGELCEGTSEIPEFEGDIAQLIGQSENVLFNSVFTHASGSRLAGSDLSTFYKQPNPSFDGKLIPYEKKKQEILAKFSRS